MHRYWMKGKGREARLSHSFIFLSQQADNIDFLSIMCSSWHLDVFVCLSSQWANPLYARRSSTLVFAYGVVRLSCWKLRVWPFFFWSPPPLRVLAYTAYILGENVKEKKRCSAYGSNPWVCSSSRCVKVKTFVEVFYVPVYVLSEVFIASISFFFTPDKLLQPPFGRQTT